MSRKNIENVYSLSPLQEGLLFHALYASQRSVYAVQIGWTLEGRLDVPALRRALTEVLERHAILRTCFVWERLDKPLQVVRKRVELPLEELDLRALAADQQAAAIARFAEAERQRGFDLGRAPLLRFGLQTLSESRHRLVFTMHHLIIDGWSLPLLVKEIFTLYEAYSRGEPLALDRPRPYGDYIAWLKKQDRSRTEAFWREQLRGFSAPTPFRVDHPAKGGAGEGSFDERRLVLPESLARALSTFARQHRLTPSTVVQGAWALLLSRYSGEDDVLFGATVSGRSAPLPGIDRMVGVFINTLAVRVRVQPESQVLPWLAALQGQQSELRDHEHSPLVEVQGLSEIPRGTPLFESQVAFENYPEAEALVSAKGALTLAEPAMRSQTHYPITLAVSLRRELVLHLSYDTRRFEADTLGRMLGHYRNLLEGLLDARGRALGELPLLGVEEREQILVGWNQSSLSIPEHATIVSLFEAQCDRTPDSPALIAGGETLTFRELDRRANRLAHRLRRLGVGPDSPVGLLLGRSALFVVALLGVIKAGGAYVPLDPSHPSKRLGQIVDEAAIRVVVSESALSERLPERALSVVRLDDEAESLAEESSDRLESGAGPGDLIYVLFTSGSTGVPKGVAVEHRQLVNYVYSVSQRLALSPDASYAHVSTLSADLGNTVLFPPLCLGGCLHLLAEELTTDPDGFAAYAQAHSIDCLKIVPSHLGALLSGAHPERVLPRKVLVLGGEASSWELIERIERLAPSLRILNHYGPTETTVGVLTEALVRGHRVVGAATVPVGRPLPNSRIYVLDAQGQPLPVGVPGELYIGGAGVARGYLNRAEQTAERFVSDPFAGGRMYRSGDRVRSLADGTVVFLGRMDHQIKIRGYRIELGEIEAALAAHPGIREAVVLVREESGDKRLMAYVVPREAPGPGAGDLSTYLEERLPAYMLPSSIVTIAALPLTPNGKIDRRALALLDQPREEVGDEMVAPRSPVEEVLASIWADVFGRERIGVHESFAELGGHSLLAIQIIARVREAFRAQVPLRAIFDAPTIAALAERVEAAVREEEGLIVPPIERIPRDRPLRLSFAQERLWFLDQLEPESALYNVPFGIRLGGQLDETALRRALGELVRRHEVLRTTFASVEGRPVQVIHPEVALALPLVDLSPLDASSQEERTRAEIRAEAARPFRLTEGPLLRARLLRLSGDEHVLLVTMHHIVSDGWTRGILNRELGLLYGAFRAGAPSPLPELALQYADYAEWQRSWLTGEVLDKQLSYWKKELDGAPLVLDLPIDRPRPSVQTHRGAQRSALLSAALSRGLKDLARREGVTLYMVLLVALYVLLYRSTGQGDFLVGTSITNRTRAETERLIGFFINALVLRARVSPDLSFLALLAQVRETCLGAYAHQDMPFERLVQELAPPPDPGRSPVFQVIFTMHNAVPEAMKLSGLTLRRMGTEIESSKYDLTFVMGEGPGAVGCSIAYKVDLFEAATIERMLGHFVTLLEGIVATPEKRVSELPLLSAEERHRLLHTWNDTATPFPENVTIASLFEAQADRTPDAPVLVAGGETLTFRELDARANRLAHRLRRLGVGPDSPVGLLLGRSVLFVVALLGVIKAGGAYVPLDPSHPSKRLGQLVDEAAIRVVVSESALLERLPERALSVIYMDAEAESLAQESSDRLESTAGPGHLVYVLFTSGSTGVPKGVAVEHRQLVNYVYGVSQRLALSPDASYAHVSTLSADLGNTVLFPPLCLGGCLHLLAEELTTDPEGVAAYAQAQSIDCLKIVPSHLGALLSGAHPEGVLPRKVLVLGGEASSWELIERIERLAPSLRILNHYGPTETTVGVLTEALVRGHRVAGAATVPVGRPLPNSRMYVLDAQGQPVPVGVPGELYIGGAGVARGYLNRAEQTAERFVSDPFAGGRMYRSGDRVRTLVDGTVVFLGRMDHQIKIRGYRIELGEIEAALAAHPGIREAVVLVREDAGDKRLMAYVVLREAPGLGAGEISAYLEERLPAYMLPSSIVTIAALPLTPNGKIDRRALAMLERPAEEIAEDIALPRTPVEEVLAGLWADVFGREGIGIHESFSELGGHSLLAIQIVARARDAFQTTIPLRSLFESPTIAGLALRIEQILREGQALDAPPVVRIPREGPLRLSFAQERLWFLAQLDPESASYNVPLGLRLGGALDQGALERAIAAIVQRHEVLRTTFAVEGEQPVQIVHAEMAIPLPVEDLTSLPRGDREGATRQRLLIESRRPFDLLHGPVLRARLFRLDVDEHVLLLTLHHIVSDALARGILVRELFALYRAFHAGEPSPLPPLPLQYADHAEWQRRWLEGGALERQLGYWKQQLEGAPRTLELPLDRPRPPIETHRGARRSFRLPPELTSRLASLARREGVTLFMTLLAAFEMLIARHTGQDDFLVGTPAANRGRQSEGLIGLFLNTLVLRATLSPDLTFLALLAQVRETCLGAYAHQDLPFERLVQELEPERDLARSPLFQVMFTFQTTTSERLALPGLAVSALGVEGANAKFDLTLGMGQGREGLGGTFEYNADLFDPETLDRMVDRLQTLLESITEDPGRRLADLPLLPATERHRLLVEWNQTAAETPRDRSVLDLFLAQAERSPEAIALSFEGQTLSYLDLATRSRRLGSELRRRGVGPGKRIGIALGRSLDLVVSVLGIWQAGAAYVPLDPAYPRERLSFMIRDAGLALVLSEQSVLGSLPESGAPLFLLDVDRSWAAEDEPSEGQSAGPEDLAYVIYTSGSTGQPKGVEILHRSLVSFLWSMRSSPGIESGDRLLALTSLSFDIAGLELFLPLICGARVEIVGAATVSDGAALIACFERSDITLMQATPSTYRLLLEAGWQGNPGLKVLVGGEAVPRELVNRLVERSASVWNMYGPTETTIWSCVEQLSTGEGPVSIGRPIANTRVYLLDSTLALAPLGVPGELCIGGDGLARGYLDRPDLTRARFITAPFLPGERLYRTGDLCRFRADGRLDFLGRLDQQVKLRGHRIELGEIEAALGAHPDIAEAVVTIRDDSSGDGRLVAYLVPRGEALPGSAEMRSFLREKLPDIMIPSAHVQLGALPLTANGKVDRRALPAPDLAPSAEALIAPRGPVEETVAAIFAEVLGLDASLVGAHDGFFSLGGHSLLGTRVMARIQSVFRVDLPLRSLFEASSPAELAERVERALRAGGAAELPPLARAARDRPLPLSFAEERLWFLNELEPDAASYVLPLLVRLDGPLDIDALEQAIHRIADRHEVLRTTFRLEGEGPVRIIHPTMESVVGRSSSPLLLGAEIRREVAEELRKPFDLRAGPLLRARLIALGEDDHALLLTMHHIAGDAWSLGILEREIRTLYDALRAGKEARLGDLPIQYADYAVWQRGWLRGEALEALLSAWKEKLQGSSFVLDLPADRPRPRARSSRGGRYHFSVPLESSAGLDALSRSENATSFMTLLSAFVTLLHRYTGQADLVVGTPIANRTRAETEGLIGFFVNTLVLRAEPSPDLPFRELLRSVRETCLWAYAHQDLPFERLVQELSPERDLGRTPLFQVMFTLQNARTQTAPAGRGGEEPLTPTAKFDLLLAMVHRKDGLQGSFEYSTDLFDAATIERMAGHFQILLSAIARAPSTRLGELPLLAEAETHALLSVWNQTTRPYPREAGLAELFEAQVERSPEAEALVFDGVTIDYRTLNERANQLARHLIDRGVQPGERVGICAPRTPALVIGLLAILKAGGAYVPLDPAHPCERLAFLIADAELSLLLADDETLSALPPSAARIVRLSEEILATKGAENPARRSGGGDLAYVIYTSGSTGVPKGVLVPQRAVTRLVIGTDYIALGPSDRVAQASNAAFDAATFEIWGALLNGACLIFLPREITLSARPLAELLVAERITTLFLTTALFNGIVRELPSAFKTLKTVLFGGEAVDPGVVREALREGPEHLLHVYGPTETTTFATWYPVESVPDEATSVPIGQPIANTVLYVLDERGKLCPVGVAGELYIGGDGVAQGYLNRPELTAERFVPDPFASGGGGRLYRTGDLVRRRADGNVVFLGRLDQQIKIRGYRVELGEIEAVLAGHPAVEEAAVLLWEDTPGDKKLVAYVAGGEGALPRPAELRAFLEQKLPAYMVPALFVSLSALPLTPNGKVDRRALPEPSSGALPESAGEAPRDPVEEALVSIFAEVLKIGVEQVGIRGNFFTLGGHSLLATQALSRIQRAFDIDLPLLALFEGPTPAELAQRVEAALQGGTGIATPPLLRLPREGALPLSFAQERLWFLDQLGPAGASYVIPLALRLEGHLNIEALRRSLEEIVRRHQPLRTTFAMGEGLPIQIVHAPGSMTLPVSRWPSLTRAEREEAARRGMADLTKQPFDLAEGPLFRAQLFAIEDDDHLLVLSFHHIVADGWTMGVLGAELGALYQAFSEGAPSPLAELPIEYADYAVWQRCWLTGEALAQQLAYWKGKLDGAPQGIDLPLDHPRPSLETHRGSRVRFALPTALVQALRELARREGATLFMVLLSAFFTLLHRFTGQGDLVVGSPIAGRTRAETERLIGFFVNTLVLRVELEGASSFQSLLGRVKETCLGAYAHQDLPFERLVQELSPERNLARSPLFQVMFTLQNAPREGISLPGLQVRGVPGESTTAKFDLTLAMSEGAEGLHGSFEYATDLFDAATIERIRESFLTLLGGIAARPGAPLFELPILGEAERRKILVTWNDTAVEMPGNPCIHELFEAQVDRSPEAVALLYRDQSVTYRELEERANRLARALVALGVGPEHLVGVCLERSIELVVALFAVLKAGGAYVPLDPSYPRDRLEKMLEDARPKVVLTDGRCRSLLPDRGACTIVLDAPNPSIEAESPERLAPRALPGNLAYVIFTSGSTGRPKGAMIEHRGAVNYLRWCIEVYRIAEGQGAPVHSSIAFDLTVTSLFAPLLAGRPVTLVPEELGVDGLADALRKGHDFSLVKLTPSHLDALSQQLSPGDVASRVRALIIGGEALLPRHLAFFRTHSPGTRLINEYGPTETVVGCAVHEQPEGALPSGTIPIGRPIANTRLYLLDHHRQPVPVGVTGELYVGGAQVGRGYLGQPELTAASFLPDPFSSKEGDRLYRTGDLCRYLPGGELEYKGRVDHQIKLRGYRIELGEIEIALARHPRVGESVAVVREDQPGDRRLVAYLVDTAASGGDPVFQKLTASELRSFLGEQLPPYMIPSAFVVLERLPLTRNGKVDRESLPPPEGASMPGSGEEYRAPTSEIEQTLTAIWASVLRLPQVGVHDNFFELGGDSILGIQVVVKAQHAGLRLTARQLFEHQTVAELAEVAGLDRAPLAEQGPVVGAAPLTPIQRWWLEQDLLSPQHWNQAFFFEALEALDPDALEQALAALLVHHDALRLRLSRTPEGREQVFAAPEEGAKGLLRRVSLAGASPEKRERLLRAVATEVQTSLDLTQGPLLRAAVFQGRGADPDLFFLAIHHLAVDTVSWRILLEDLWTAYQQRRRGEAIKLPLKTTSFKRWAEALFQEASGDAIRAELDHWLSPRRRAVASPPLDHDRGENDERSARSIFISLDAEETESLLREVPRAYRTQINDALLAAFGEALSGWLESTDVLFDLEGHGREEPSADIDVTRTVGWFTTIFPVLLEIPAHPDPSHLLTSVKEQLRAIPRHGLGHGLLLYLRPEDDELRELRALPKAEVAFNYLGQLDRSGADDAPLRRGKQDPGPAHCPEARRRYLLEVTGSVLGGRLQLRFSYSENRHEAATIQALAERFLASLRAIIAHCQSPGAGGYTPSDFEEEDLSQEDIRGMLAALDGGDQS